ncbi:ATP-binding protein [Deltaproteobacteria bacterium TL4]
MNKKIDQQLFNENMEVLDYLKQSRLLGDLPEALLEDLVQISEFNNYFQGTEILKEGEINTKIYFLVRGSVSVYTEGEKIISFQRVGDIFGEMSIISHKPCSATVIADTPVRTFSMRTTGVGRLQEIVNTESLQFVLYRLFSTILTEKLSLTTNKAKQYEAANRELLQTKEELQQSNEKLNQSNRQLKATQAQLIQSSKLVSIGEMATGIAHELNQPLGYIRTHAQLATMNEVDGLDVSTAYKALKLVEEGTTRMMKIMTHLKSFARQTGFDLQPVNLYESLENSLILLNEQLRLHNIEVIKKYSPSPTSVLGNTYQLEQVFINLITNARDALESRKNATLTIEVELCPNANAVQEVHIHFTDNGCGIAEQYMDKLFDPFFTTKEVGKGTGLGLSISYGIIQEHHGEIKVASTEGEGATFSVILPVIHSYTASGLRK